MYIVIVKIFIYIATIFTLYLDVKPIKIGVTFYILLHYVLLIFLVNIYLYLNYLHHPLIALLLIVHLL